VTWVERQLERLRSLNPLVVDRCLAAFLFVLGVVTVHAQEIEEGMRAPSGFAVLTVLAVTAPVAFRRVRPLSALVVGCAGIFVHTVVDWPEGSNPTAVLLLTYSVAAWGAPRRAPLGLGVVYLTLCGLGLADTPGLDALGVFAQAAFFTVAWTVGIALRARRRRSRQGCERLTSRPTSSVRAPPAPSPRSGCASRRSSTTWWRTPCR
jgi:hypothetical protein